MEPALINRRGLLLPLTVTNRERFRMVCTKVFLCRFFKLFITYCVLINVAALWMMIAS
jgi:hypothetical protein